MFRLKSNALQREFKVNEGYLYASRIRNTRSGMDLVPDGQQHGIHLSLYGRHRVLLQGTEGDGLRRAGR